MLVFPERFSLGSNGLKKGTWLFWESHFQGCALQGPRGRWRLTFAPGRLWDSYFPHANHILGTRDFTCSEHWASFKICFEHSLDFAISVLTGETNETCLLNLVPGVLWSPLFLHFLPESRVLHFLQTVSFFPSQDFSTSDPGGHCLHFLHTTFEVGVHGRISYSSSRQREQGLHAFLRDAWEENVPSLHCMQRMVVFWGQKDECPAGHFWPGQMVWGERCASVLLSD